MKDNLHEYILEQNQLNVFILPTIEWERAAVPCTLATPIHAIYAMLNTKDL